MSEKYKQSSARVERTQLLTSLLLINNSEWNSPANGLQASPLWEQKIGGRDNYSVVQCTAGGHSDVVLIGLK